MNNLGIYREKYNSWDETIKNAVTELLATKNSEINPVFYHLWISTSSTHFHHLSGHKSQWFHITLFQIC